MSQLYQIEKKVTEAHWPRLPGTTIFTEDQRKLKICYAKYSSTSTPVGSDKIRINLVFSHGTGMNKDVWKYHIDQLYQKSQTASNWYLGSVLSIDSISHGDSALINGEYLGWVTGWGDAAKDIIKVVKHEAATCNDFLNDATSRTIAIGHSFGGHQTLMAGFYEPQLFDTVVPIEAPYYHNLKYAARFFRIFTKIKDLLLDEFDSLEEFTDYYTKMSFYQTMDPQVLKDFVESEYYTVYDPATDKVKYKSKASKNNQIALYFSSAYSLLKSTQFLPYFECKVVYVLGEDATWNPKESHEYFKDHIHPTAFADYIQMSGTHLGFGEYPDEMVDLILGVVSKRATASIENAKHYPETKFHGDRKAILNSQREILLGGQPWESIDFSEGHKEFPRL